METRILIYAPTGQDGPLASHVLSLAHLDNHVCLTLADLAEQLAAGVGAVLTVEEALTPAGYKLLHDHVARQPDWSDLPILLLTHHGADTPTVRKAVAGLGNLSLLERPARTLTLITALQSTLRARHKQYQVREAARRKDEFLASLGHELRNPLAPIRTSVSLLTHLYPDAAPVARIRDMVERQVKLLTRLVDDLLDVARITSGKIKLQTQLVSLQSVMNHVNELCTQSASAKRIHVTWQLPMTEVMLDADYARLVQIFANILSNAVKFTPQGGNVVVRASVSDRTLTVALRDSGIGLAPEAIARIFTMFEQSATVSGQFTSGLGIGLSLARQFAEMHGGSVQAFSDGAGLGSEFVIHLPIVNLAHADADGALPAASTALPAPAAADGKRMQVLVVDDNEDAADSLALLLEADGFDARAVYGGAAAVAAVGEDSSGAPDMIIMDLGMPGMDGYEAARLIRQRPGAEKILLIALTGWGQTDARRRTAEAGFDHHLVKPVELAHIVRLAGARHNRDQVQAAR
jgi:signal transduction histidine kinase/ActR/RegA family two-component response regulator